MRGGSSPIATISVVSLLLVMTLAACGEAADPGPTTSTTAPTSTSESQVPEQFPEPSEIQELDVLTLSADDVHVQWEVGMSAEETVDFYTDSLPAEGWEISSQREGGDSTRFAISGHGWDGAVTVLGGEPVRVLLQLGVSEDR